MQKIVLASQSPRRKQLLTWAEIPFEVCVKETDEAFPAGMPIPEVPVYIARNKALAVMHDVPPDRIILAADTIVVLDDQVIGKPSGREDAILTLQKLSGKTHRVITGVVLRKANEEHCFADITEVTFHDLTLDQITYYVDRYQPYDKAGAYAIQEWIGVVGIAKVSGDFYNVMGLPISRLVKSLQLLTKS